MSKTAAIRTLVIVNPMAHTGRLKRQWPQIASQLQDAIGAFDTVFTKAHEAPPHLARRSKCQTYGRVIAVGGDGTANNVINALAHGSGSRRIKPHFGVLMFGTANDLVRSLGLSKGMGSLAALKAGKTKLMDLGRVEYRGHDGKKHVHWFHNIANVGLVASIVAAVHQSPLTRLLGGLIAYPLVAAQVMPKYRGKRFSVSVNGRKPRDIDALSIVVANCKYFGAGMKVAPMANHGDGQLDVIVLKRAPKAYVHDIARLYGGKHMSHPAVEHFRAKRISFITAENATTLCECDGESLGHLPCTIDVVPGKLRVIC